MAQDRVKTAITDILAAADVKVNGTRPWDITVHDERLYGRIAAGGSLAIGEAYMDGWWDCDKLDEAMFRVLRADLHRYVRSNPKHLFFLAQAKILNRSTKSKSFEIAHRHYNLGNDLYASMLDKRMAYSCGYWKDAKTLDEAQEAKFDLICRKVGLAKGMDVLDIGGGWGSFAGYAAEKYGAHVTNITVSVEQVKLADERYKHLPIKNVVMDYRDLPQKQYDRIISIGMFEHVGPRNYRTFMEVARKHLKDDGLLLLHTIAANQSEVAVDPWIDRYIFPNSVLPSIAQIGKSIENLWVMEDWHNFGPDYDKTLMAWYGNFVTHWPELSSTYDERFKRMWEFYLQTVAGSFRTRNIQVWQIVLSPRGIVGGYKSLR